MSARFPTGWRGDAIVLLLTALWFAVTGWVRPLMLPDEGRYVGVAWEMLRSGNWLVPTLNGLPYFHKPPLFYWITGASLAQFGLHEWAARTAPLLGATAGAFALYLFTRRWAGMQKARIALIVLATQPLVYIAAQFSNLDMLVAGCITATILAFAHAALAEPAAGRVDRRALAAGYLFAALGVLAKGLIGVVLPALAIAAWLLWLGRWRLIPALLWPPGLLLFLAVAAPWFYAMQQRFPDFSHYFFVVQHFDRFAQGGFNNPQPFWFYPVVLALLTLPWPAWLPAIGARAYWADPQDGPLRKLMWLWLLIITTFFSLPQSKLVGYILPACAPLAFVIADGLARASARSARARRWWQASAALAVLACLGTLLAVTAYPRKSHRELGRLLAQHMAAGQQVIFVKDYYFDLAFYGSLRAPVKVIEDWDKPELTQRDSWRKELLDAGQFAPDLAASIVVKAQDVDRTMCHAAGSWILGDPQVVDRYPFLREAAVVARTQDTVLWELSGAQAAAAAACPGKPNASSAGK